MMLAPAVPAWADAPGHTVDDSRGEVGKKDPGTGTSYVSLPEVDLWWVDVEVLTDEVEVIWRVANLSHRTFPASTEGLNFLCWWSLLAPDGTPNGTGSVVAERAAIDAIHFQTRYEYDDGTSRIQVTGEFDWSNSTVRARIPLSLFESGTTLLDPLAWSTATTQNTVGIRTSTVQFGDRAPDTGWDTTDVRIP